MTRFLSFVTRFRDCENEAWHVRLCGWLYLGLQLGILKGSTLGDQLGAMAKASAEAAEESGGPMARATAEMNRIRAASCNALHLGILLFSNPDNQVRSSTIKPACFFHNRSTTLHTVHAVLFDRPQ